MNFRSAAPVLFLLLTISFPLAAQRSRFDIIPAPKEGGGDVRLMVAPGGRVEGTDEYSVLEGDVTIEYQDIKLRANKVTYNNLTKDVTAEGNVVIDQGATRITATQAIYNLESKVGTFFNATGTMDPELHFSGSRIEKVDHDTYQLTDGVLTSCDLDRPAWSFHVGSAEVTMNDYAHLRDVSFRARRLPIFWTPRLLFPTKKERSQGLLLPRLQFSNVSNVRVELGYFIPFGDSADATITADLTTVGHYGGGINARYVPSENVKIGEIDLYGVFGPSLDSFGLPDEEKDFRWRYRWQHAQDNLPNDFRGVIDIQDFSDLEFFRRFDRNPELTTLSNIYSSAYLTKNRPRYSLNILASRRELVFATQQHFEQLPAVQLRMYPQRVMGTPLYFSMESSASHLRTNAIAGTTETTAYYRTDLFPTLSLQMRTPPWFSIRPQISARGTYYSASLERDADTGRNRLSEDGIDRFYMQGQVEMVGPSFSRIYNRQIRGFTRFKHVIEPRFRYVYTSGEDRENQGRIIRFDTVDSPFLPIVRDTLEYSLTQRIIGKEAGPNGAAREVMSLSLRQTAALSKPFTTATGSSSTFAEHKFTPLDATLRVNPYQSITVDATARFGSESRQLDQTSLSANLVGTGKRAGEYLSLTWFATYRNPETPFSDSSQFRISSGGTFLDDRLRADVQLSYDAKDNKFIEQRYILGGTGSCYGLAVAYRRFLIYPRGIEDTDHSVEFQISLKNVGTIGSLR